jgi:hypothetical protein
MLDVELETEIRNIIYDDYCVGHQNIESKEIYFKLIARGIEVPENAMARIIKSLKDRGLIKAAGKMNSEEARKHGAYSIMWVGRHIAV